MNLPTNSMFRFIVSLSILLLGDLLDDLARNLIGLSNLFDLLADCYLLLKVAHLLVVLLLADLLAFLEDLLGFVPQGLDNLVLIDHPSSHKYLIFFLSFLLALLELLQRLCVLG